MAVKGLMAIPPPSSDPEQARLYFRPLRELVLRLLRQPISTLSLKELAMGISNDYHVAVEEGATIVRLGTAILAGRGKTILDLNKIDELNVWNRK